MKPRIAVISFPGNNCEVESIRAIRRSGMEAVPLRWNASRDALREIDGYFLPGGFSYEDRGRSGMIAARDPLFAHIAREAEEGKVVIGNCNGAQMLVESGLIPLGEHLDMSIARNVVSGRAVGFLNEWVWIARTCARGRCATSDWEGAMHLPIAHGEGRFKMRDADLLEEMKRGDQIAFRYCTALGEVSEDPEITPNGAMYAIAGICNPAGNVVALMPHPERTIAGDAYFLSVKWWIESRVGASEVRRRVSPSWHADHSAGRDGRHAEVRKSGFNLPLAERSPRNVEIFIDTIIVNNEERTIEQVLCKHVPGLRLRQLKYLSTKKEPREILSRFSVFNPNKETAYVRRRSRFAKWNADGKCEDSTESAFGNAMVLLRRDDPDTGAGDLGDGGQSGICYICSGARREELLAPHVLEIFANPHASTIEILVEEDSSPRP